MPRIKNLLLILLLILPATSLFPVPGNPVIERVRNSLNRIKPFKVLFVQQVFDDEQLEIEESGEIIFKDQDRLKWTYLDPDYKVFILEGDEYKFYDKENEQLTIGKVKDKNRQWIWQLLFSRDMADYISVDEKNGTIRIKREEDALDIEIFLDKSFLPARAIQRDPSGAKLVYYFKEYREKIKTSGDLFKLDIPEGVDIIVE